MPPSIIEFISRYEDLLGGRDEFLWKWIYHLFPAFELSTVPTSEQDAVRTEKTILTIFVTVLDDLVEERGDMATFHEARYIPFDAARVRHDHDDVDGEVLGYLLDLWIELDPRLRDTDRYDEFEDIFLYDIRQTLNSMQYGATMTGHLTALNRPEYFRYASHNMCMFPYSDIDAMHSPNLVSSDIGTLRSVLWDVQELARIGNDVTTWEREIDEHDFSSGIVACAVQDGVVTTAELENDIDEESVKSRIQCADIEEQFMAQWKDQFREIQTRADRLSTESVDVSALVTGMQTVFEHHLESRGRK